MGIDKVTILREIDQTLAEHAAVKGRARHDDGSDLKDGSMEAVAARLVTTIERFAPPGSFYARQAREFTTNHWGSPHVLYKYLPPTLKALRDDIAHERTASVVELVHADVFSDFLEMAQYLLDDGGFKDPAAVIAGSSLEAHLRALCDKHGIATTDANNKPKKADTLNHELEKAGAYTGKLDLKNVTAWLGLRNDAAHGDYAKYQAGQVGLLISSVRDFMTRYPA
jgi:hypothetical protein